MTIYLYKKTHNKTGLQYLGKTSKDPYKYRGSGQYWTRHIKQYGYDVTTEILKECETNDEIAVWGIYYSNLWNIVEDRTHDGKKTWANLKPESGDGGAQSKYSIEKGIATKRQNGTLNTNTPSSIAKGVQTKKVNGTLNTNTCESRVKAIETRRKNNTLNTNTPESVCKGIETKRKNGTLSRSTECRTAIIETRIKNGTLNTRTSENIEKQRATILETGNNNFIKNNPSQQQKVCPHCRKSAGGGNFTRWHGENCKSKQL